MCPFIKLLVPITACLTLDSITSFPFSSSFLPFVSRHAVVTCKPISLIYRPIEKRYTANQSVSRPTSALSQCSLQMDRNPISISLCHYLALYTAPQYSSIHHLDKRSWPQHFTHDLMTLWRQSRRKSRSSNNRSIREWGKGISSKRSRVVQSLTMTYD